MPLRVKILALLIVAYIISPIDIIPDFIPVLGLLDEVILVPIMLSFTMSLIPDEIRQEYQQQDVLKIENRGLAVMGIIMVLLVWSTLVALSIRFYLMLRSLPGFLSGFSVKISNIELSDFSSSGIAASVFSSFAGVMAATAC